MLTGAFILAVGLIGGYFAANYLNKKPKIYDKYKNKDGLYSRRAVKESR